MNASPTFGFAAYKSSSFFPNHFAAKSPANSPTAPPTADARKSSPLNSRAVPAANCPP
ncbi:hypothetical protein ACWEKT_00470 [Nocardia takedensis]